MAVPAKYARHLPSFRCWHGAVSAQAPHSWVSQKSPLANGGHSHVNELTPSTHTPEFWHEVGVQSSTFMHVSPSPVKPLLHVHVKLPISASDFAVSTTNGMSTDPPVLTPISSRSFFVEVVVVGPLVSGNITLSLPQSTTTPRNAAASASATYVAPTPVVFSLTHNDATPRGMDFEFTIHVRFELPVTGFTPDMLHIDTTTVVIETMNMTTPTPDLYSFAFRLGATPGPISFSVNNTYGTAVTPAHTASNVFTIDYIGRCANHECSSDDGSPRVCVHSSAASHDVACFDFLRNSAGGILYPFVCPPGTEVCPQVAVPDEQPLAEGWCTSCAGESSGPCQHVGGNHDGTCHAYLDAATKTCPPGTVTCNECDRLAPCDHGSCVDLVHDYTCMCEPMWLGKDCDNHDDCAVNSCAPTGECVDGTGSEDGTYSCKCDPGYDGEFCAQEIDECAPGPCQNGGVCTDLLADYSCDCTGTGYTGVGCDVDVNECDTNNGGCHANADCTNTAGSHSCACSAGYAGDGVRATTSTSVTPTTVGVKRRAPTLTAATRAAVPLAMPCAPTVTRATTSTSAT